MTTATQPTTTQDPFGTPVHPDTLCPLCGLPLGPDDGSVHGKCADYENHREDIEHPADWTCDDVPDSPWPPTDEAELAALDAWTDAREREHWERVGGGNEE